MEHKIYQISEAEQLTGEKAHVLRYWEEELGITIGRNAMGHRFYTAEDIQIFLSIKELKKKGLHLKASGCGTGGAGKGFPGCSGG